MDPRTYITSRFTYAFVQAVQGISHDKENVEFDLGYFITPYLSVQGMWHWQQTLGGIDVPIPREPAIPLSRSTRARQFHRRRRLHHLVVLGPCGFSFSYLTGIQGRNGHKVDDAFAFSYDYQFGNH